MFPFLPLIAWHHPALHLTFAFAVNYRIWREKCLFGTSRAEQDLELALSLNPNCTCALRLFQPAPESCCKEPHPLHDAGKAVHPSAREEWQGEISRGAPAQLWALRSSSLQGCAEGFAVNGPCGFFGNEMDRTPQDSAPQASCSPSHHTSQVSRERSGLGPWRVIDFHQNPNSHR